MRKTAYFLIFFLFLSVLFILWLIKKEPEIDRLNLLFITLDTTRADSIGIYGNEEVLTPNIDMLGRKGIVFKNCYAPVPLTLPSHCSMFTGQYPITHQVRNNGNYFLNDRAQTLAEIFESEMVHTAAIVASFTLFSKFGLNQGFDFYDEMFDSVEMILNFHSEITADRVYDKFVDWFDNHEGERFFLWVHFFDPHFPYNGHSDIDKKFSDTEMMKYYGEISFMDRYVGKIFQKLEEKNLVDKTLIVLVGDHGEAFGEHQEYGHGIFCYEESLKVPLIFYNPQLLKGSRLIESRVNLVDIMPTLLDIFGFDIPETVQGRSFLRLLKGRRSRHNRLIFFESLYGKEKNNWAPLTGVIHGNFKYISLPDPELYDLKNDSRETINLFKKKVSLARRLDKVLREFAAEKAVLTDSSRRKLTPEDIKRLRSLGYMSSFSGKSSKTIDPKIGVSLYGKIENIKELLKARAYPQAERALNQLASNNPDIHLPNLYEAKYQILKNTGRESEAITVLQEGLKKFPHHEELKMQLATDLFSKNEWQKTEQLCHQLLERNSLFTGAHVLLGDMNEGRNRIGDALFHYEQAFKIEPQNRLIKTKFVLLLIKNNEYRKADPLLRELEESDSYFKNPAQVDMLSEIAKLFAVKGMFERAISILTRVTSFASSKPDAWVNLGTVYFQGKRFDEAMESYERALKINPDFAIAYSNIGMIHLNRFLQNSDLGLQKQALKNFTKALKLDPKLAEAYSGRGVVLFSSHKIHEAIKDFKHTIALKPDFFDATVNLSIAYRHIGSLKEALFTLRLYKKRYFDRLSKRDQEYLNRLIAEVEKQ